MGKKYGESTYLSGLTKFSNLDVLQIISFWNLWRLHYIGTTADRLDEEN